MNRRQQNIHKWSWLLIVLAMPVVSFIALRGISETKVESSTLLRPDQDSSLVLTEKGELGAILEDREGSSELIIKLFQPLKSASTLVYSADGNGEKGTLLGQLQSVGEYSFMLSERPEGIILYDAIKATEIEKLEFKWE